MMIRHWAVAFLVILALSAGVVSGIVAGERVVTRGAEAILAAHDHDAHEGHDHEEGLRLPARRRRSP